MASDPINKDASAYSQALIPGNSTFLTAPLELFAEQHQNINQGYARLKHLMGGHFSRPEGSPLKNWRTRV